MQTSPQFRIGQGIDVHPFSDGRKLMLGGIEIPHSQGLSGHSDADVLLHAVSDAILGALGWGDIGQWFPNTDEKFRDIESSTLLEQIWRRVTEEGWRLGNLDCTVLAESPKIAPFSAQIIGRIAGLLGAEKDQISLKATTTERLGFIGRDEGIAAFSIVLLLK